jgi:hypothetical protein
MTAQIARLPARRCFRQAERLGLARDGRLGSIDAELRQIEQAINTLRAKRLLLLREYRRELYKPRVEAI